MRDSRPAVLSWGMGNPTTYTPEIAENICELIASGNSLRTICADHDDMPALSTVFLWLSKFPNFSEQYARARETWAEAELENIFDIADDTSRDTMTRKDRNGNEYEVADNEWIARSKLRVDTRRWALSKLAPKKYGDKITNELTGPNGQSLGSLSDEQIAMALNKLAQRVAPKHDDDVSDLV